ncbi:MAG: hypothetical protein J6J16_00280 [Lachnospiraceae bacterium]|nr:hypothetical protein [Lachnospiraceae bacterium]
MRRIKKLGSLMLIAALAFSLCACGKDEDTKKEDKTEKESVVDTTEESNKDDEVVKDDEESVDGSMDEAAAEMIGTDIKTCKTIKTAVEVALGNEGFFTLLTYGGNGVVIELTPGGKDATAVNIVGADTEVTFNDFSNEQLRENLTEEILTNIGTEIPAIQYAAQLDGSSDELAMYYVYVSDKGTVYVYLAPAGKTMDDLLADAEGDGIYVITPETAAEYEAYK